MKSLNRLSENIVDTMISSIITIIDTILYGTLRSYSLQLALENNYIWQTGLECQQYIRKRYRCRIRDDRSD